MSDVRTRRIYDDTAPDDGYRVLVDRLWPRGISRERAGVDEWLPSVAPSNELRKWFRHETPRHEEFVRRYFAELDALPPGIEELLARARAGTLTLVYSARDREHNQAVALRAWIEARLGNG